VRYILLSALFIVYHGSYDSALSKEEFSSIIHYIVQIMNAIDVARFISNLIISLLLLFYVTEYVRTNSIINN